MKTIFEAVISRGGYDLAGLLANIDKYHIEGKLTDSERDALYAEARAKATATASVDVADKLTEMESRMREMESRIKALEGADSSTGGTTGGTPEQTETAPEYTAGKWYYAGDKVTFGGKVYTCTAPAGLVCVWSPATYPAYWTEVTE